MCTWQLYRPVRPERPSLLAFRRRMRVNPAIAVGRHIGDDRFDLIHEAPISKQRSSTGLGRHLLHTLCDF